jgi:anti-sigma regulatory factor (Ser/Thr protein kinase)
MITAAAERDMLAATIRGGATDYLDKPVPAAAFARALESACTATRRLRALGASHKSAEAIGRMQRRVIGTGCADRGRIMVRHQPIAEAGGDFVTVFTKPDGGTVLLVADVSGHDLSAAYTAAYFQGLVRGMVERSAPIAEVLARFNTLLMHEWNDAASDEGSLHVSASVAGCAVTLEPDALRGAVTNAGFPAPTLVMDSGEIHTLAVGGGSPLGWFDNAMPNSVAHTFGPNDLLFLWTDGLADAAEDAGVSVLAAATAMLCAPAGRVHQLQRHAVDDMLLVVLMLGPIGSDGPPVRDVSARWHPVVEDQYHGNEHHVIDALQHRWHACLALAVPELSDSRTFDVLLSTREMMLNALCHGCGGDASQVATLQIAFRPDRRLLRVRIADPGPGHAFDYRAHEGSAGDNMVDAHRGLSMVHQMASTVRTERDGARVILDFRY